MPEFEIIPLTHSHRDWAVGFIQERWGSLEIVSRGRIHHADELPGFVAVVDIKPCGLATYRIEGSQCEIVTMNSLKENIGIGTALIEAVRDEALDAGCKRLWLVTTNDNLHALRFYQKRGFSMVMVHRNAIKESRRLKPQIPTIGIDGIPILHEIELEMRL